MKAKLQNIMRVITAKTLSQAHVTAADLEKKGYSVRIEPRCGLWVITASVRNQKQPVEFTTVRTAFSNDLPWHRKAVEPINYWGTLLDGSVL